MLAKNEEGTAIRRERKGRRSKYQKISEALREEIIDRLVYRKEGLRDVASKLRINHSTCKAIVKVYESEGRIGKKKTRNRNVQVLNTFTICLIGNGMLMNIPETTISDKKVSCARMEEIDPLITEQATQQGKQLAEELIAQRRRKLQLETAHSHQDSSQGMFGFPPQTIGTYMPPYFLGVYPHPFRYGSTDM